MADPYPPTLPPLPTPLEIDPIDASISSPNDAGPRNTRPVASKTGQFVSWAQNMRGVDWNTLYKFWRDTLAMGSLPFELSDPQEDTLKDWKFRGPPRATLAVGATNPNDRLYRVTVNAEILP